MKADELRVKKICEESRKLIGEDSAKYCKDPRSFPSDVQAKLRRAGQQLEVLLKRIADDTERAKARAKAKRQGT